MGRMGRDMLFSGVITGLVFSPVSCGVIKLRDA